MQVLHYGLPIMAGCSNGNMGHYGPAVDNFSEGYLIVAAPRRMLRVCRNQQSAHSGAWLCCQRAVMNHHVGEPSISPEQPLTGNHSST